jgi:protein involved in polysaccharide export with SLBB domain
MTVRDAFDLAFGLTPSADHERVTIRRFKDGTIISVNADRVQKNIPIDNISLEPNDTILVQTKDTGLRVSVIGAVPSPRTFDFKGNITLTQAISDSGGLKPDADTHAIIIARNMLNDPSKVQQIAINYERIRRGEMPDVPLQAGDLVQVSQKKKVHSPYLSIGLMLLRTFLF